MIEQNAQPPKQPRMIWIESLTTSKAGISLPAIARVRPPRERQAVNAIDLFLRQRQCRRIDHHGLPAVILDQSPGIVRVGFLVDRPRHGGERRLVGRRPLRSKSWARANAVPCRAGSALLRWLPAGRPRRGCRAGRVPICAGRQPAHDLDQRPLAHAEDQQIGLGVQEDGPADLVAPEVVMGQPAQTGLDAAGDDRHALVGLAGSLAVGQRGPIWPPADLSAGAIGVVVAHLAVGRVVVQHRVHVAGADGEANPRPAETSARLARVPVGLAKNGHAKAGALQHAAQDGHGEAGVVDVGVAGDEHHVDRRPSRARPVRRPSSAAAQRAVRSAAALT